MVDESEIKGGPSEPHKDGLYILSTQEKIEELELVQSGLLLDVGVLMGHEHPYQDGGMLLLPNLWIIIMFFFFAVFIL